MKHGFTLVELMIVVAIIGILAATAVPLYDAYIDEASKTEAQVNLADIASKETAYFNTWDQYQSTVTSSDGDNANRYGHKEDTAYQRTIQTMAANDEWVKLGYTYHDKDDGGLFGGPVYYKYKVATNADYTAFLVCAHRWLGEDSQERITISSTNMRNFITHDDHNCVFPTPPTP